MRKRQILADITQFAHHIGNGKSSCVQCIVGYSLQCALNVAVVGHLDNPSLQIICILCTIYIIYTIKKIVKLAC